MTPRVHTARVRVRYAETDQMGVAYHGNYFAWFEVGRTDLLRDHGFSYRELEDQGLRLPIIEAQVSFRQPARYDDVLEIRTWVEEMGGARVAFSYEVHRPATLRGETGGGPSASLEPVARAQDSMLLATAKTAHAAVDPKGRPRRFPSELRQALVSGQEPQ